MSIKFEYFREPKLQFGEFFEHEDTKTGLAEFGPFGKCIKGLHPSQINLGFVGTRETISGCKEWIEACANPIESENIKTTAPSRKTGVVEMFPQLAEEPFQTFRREKILNRDFVGFSADSPFQCCFQLNPRWEKSIPSGEIEGIVTRVRDKAERIRALVALFDANIKVLAETSPSPHIIVVALTPSIIEHAHSVRISGNFFLNFRRAIKASSMNWGVPIQLLQRRTVLGKGPQLQEKATRAWNFCVAQYYKADGIPWRPVTLEQDVCFVGISFYIARDVNDKLTMRASVAQAFDYMGQGLVLRGDPFEWDEEKMGRSPHLPKETARELIKRTLLEYLKVNDMPPRRVVIHKTSEFWGPEHENYNELEGFLQGIHDAHPRCDSDLVTLRQTGVRLFREGKYPPLRGTYLTIEDAQHFLFTAGYIPYLETYPWAYVPEPWQITDHHGSSSPKDLLKEVLALTKMNVNNCAFADGTPITLSFSEKIGEIMKHIPEGGKVQPKYKFYM